MTRTRPPQDNLSGGPRLVENGWNLTEVAGALGVVLYLVQVRARALAAWTHSKTE